VTTSDITVAKEESTMDATEARTTRPDERDPRLAELTQDECFRLLSDSEVGRIAFAVNSEPWIFPVNFRLFGEGDDWRLLLATRPGNRIDRAPRKVAFEVDGVDELHRAGWSVLVRGSLRHLGHAEAERRPAGVEPATWLERDPASWLAITPERVSGRRLAARSAEWPVPDEAYL
jgi:nitroimidazol reductase NimA-like FMN-containing flavoprotein (pyridoxamine 5'-phosphate oxidase superfamily)